MSQDSRGRPDRPCSQLDRELIPLILEAVLFAETERGKRAFERLAFILTRPIKRIARARLEMYLAGQAINQDDIDQIANDALFRFYLSLPRYRPENPVIPFVAKMIDRLVIDWIRQVRHTRMQTPPKFGPLDEHVHQIAMPDNDVDDWLVISRLMEGLPPLTRELVRLASEGYPMVEIAEQVDKPAWWVRRELKKLRRRFSR